MNVTASLVVRYFVCSSCDRHGLKREWCVKPYKAIAVLSMSSTHGQTNHKVTSCEPKIIFTV